MYQFESLLFIIIFDSIKMKTPHNTILKVLTKKKTIRNGALFNLKRTGARRQ